MTTFGAIPTFRERFGDHLGYALWAPWFTVRFIVLIFAAPIWFFTQIGKLLNTKFGKIGMAIWLIWELAGIIRVIMIAPAALATGFEIGKKVLF